MRKLLLPLLALFAPLARALERFPRPEFDSGYTRPEMVIPRPRAELWQYADVGLLVLALLVGAWLIYRKRSRAGVFALAVFALLYFGFIRKGCVCAVGSIQNVALALGDYGYVIPVTVLLFFSLPLLFALFFGRVFCSGVCPLGAAQEVVLIKPVTLPFALERVLRFGPWFFLGVATVYAATSTAFLICDHDPFIPFFRLSGSVAALLSGGIILALCAFVGRAYCRFICPYGALLGLCSRLSWKRVSITPDDCIRCGLCADACPYGAILPPTPPQPQGEQKTKARRILGLLLLTVPVLALAGAGAGYRLHETIAARNPLIERARIVRLDQAGVALSPEQQIVADGFLQAQRPIEGLYAEAEAMRARFALLMSVTGGLLGLVAGLGICGLVLRPQRSDYTASRADCFACGRCYAACPRGRKVKQDNS